MVRVDAFSEGERLYLESLEAVDHVTGSRIYYADWFRDECMRRYAQGESPTKLFRAAGLDPVLLGPKRIERAFARWRSHESERRVGKENGTGTGGSGGSGGSGTGLASKPLRASGANRKAHMIRVDRVGQLDCLDMTDPRDVVIVRQSMRISRLEYDNRRLRAAVGNLMTRLSDGRESGGADTLEFHG